MGTALSSLAGWFQLRSSSGVAVRTPQDCGLGDWGHCLKDSPLSSSRSQGRGEDLRPLCGAVVGIEALSGRGCGVPDAGRGGLSWSGQPGLLGEGGDGGQLFS